LFINPVSAVETGFLERAKNPVSKAETGFMLPGKGVSPISLVKAFHGL
jgi:hypothetical protein